MKFKKKKKTELDSLNGPCGWVVQIKQINQSYDQAREANHIGHVDKWDES